MGEGRSSSWDQLWGKGVVAGQVVKVYLYSPLLTPDLDLEGELRYGEATLLT